jgi:hypothetical protein
MKAQWPAYRLYLKKGYHRTHVDFYKKNGGEALKLVFMKYPFVGVPDLKMADNLLIYKEN